MMVHPDSHRVSRALWYSGTTGATFDFDYGAITLFGRTFQTGSSIYLWIA